MAIKFVPSPSNGNTSYDGTMKYTYLYAKGYWTASATATDGAVQIISAGSPSSVATIIINNGAVAGPATSYINLGGAN